MDASRQDDSLATASLGLAGAGIVVYCCGSFLCLGWIAPLLWIAGAVVGGVALSRVPEGGNKSMAWGGIAANGLCLLAFGGLLVLGVGVYALSAVMAAMGNIF